MAKKKTSHKHASRRGTSRLHHIPKPSIALLAGLAVGPAEALFGTPSGNLQGAWNKSGSIGDKAKEFANVAGISYLGYNFEGKTQATWDQGAYWGTAGIVGGVVAHKLANMLGVNRALAASRMPFRI